MRSRAENACIASHAWGELVGGSGSWRTRPLLAAELRASEVPPASWSTQDVSTIVTTEPLTALAYSAECRASGAPT
jgi:hypothetical protein